MQSAYRWAAAARNAFDGVLTAVWILAARRATGKPTGKASGKGAPDGAAGEEDEAVAALEALEARLSFDDIVFFRRLAARAVRRRVSIHRPLASTLVAARTRAP